MEHKTQRLATVSAERNIQCHHAPAWCGALVAALILLTGCGSSVGNAVDGVGDGLQTQVLGKCVAKAPIVVLLDHSESSNDPSIRGDHRNFVAAAVTDAVKGCRDLTVSSFAGSVADIDVLVSGHAAPEGENIDERQANEGPRRAELYQLAEPHMNNVNAGGSDPQDAISWACRQLDQPGEVRIITDGMSTAPVDVDTAEMTDAKAAEVGAALGGLMDGSCSGHTMHMVGVGRLASASPPNTYIRQLRLIWSSACAAAGFAACEVETLDNSIDGAAEALLNTGGESDG